MAWTIAVVLATLGLSAILLFLNNVFEKNSQGIKILMISLTFGSLAILSQVIKLIIEDKATGDALTNLTLLATTSLIITIVLFSFFVAFFMIIYTRDLMRALRDSRKEKISQMFGDI